MLFAVRRMSGDSFVFQQDSAPAHRARDMIQRHEAERDQQQWRRSRGDKGDESPQNFGWGDRNVVCPPLLARHLARRGHELPFCFQIVQNKYIPHFLTSLLRLMYLKNVTI